MTDPVNLIPSASRLMASLRDIGYSPTTAVADLVDNSIAANATNVAIDFVFEGTDSWVRIGDNGNGMSAETLDEALRFGTRRKYASGELGKFGLGLKTASLSQCRRLTVATRNIGKAEIQIRQWDLDYVQETDSWQALRLEPRDCRPEWILPLEQSPGTIIVWDQLDRMSDFKLPDGQAARKALGRLCREIEEHLSMVFHRFLAGEARRRIPFSIVINGNTVAPWDPFARSESATQTFESQTLRVKQDEETHNVIVTPYVLPNESNFSSPEARDRAAGPNKWNNQQGFYIYRSDRMIQSGGWNRLRTPDEHSKLARVSVDFDPSADSEFGINVAKMRVVLPAEIRNDLKTIASGVVQRAKAAYRSHGTAKVFTKGARPRAPGKGEPTTRSPFEQGSAGPERNPSREAQAPSIQFLWSQKLSDGIVQILLVELSDQPETLARILKMLSQLHPEIAVSVARSEIGRRARHGDSWGVGVR